jgi:hypothetical protein
MSRRARVVAVNESKFRELNEGLDRVVGSLPGPAAYYCECADDSCDRPLVLHRGEYQQVRTDPRQFIVAPGHEDLAFEVVVADRGRYLVVRKTGEAGEVAEATSPIVRD